MNRNLTNINGVAILCLPCNSKVEFCSSFFSIGEKSPLLSVVFLRPSFHTISNCVRFIMTGLLGQPSWLTAPMRGTANSLNSVAQCLAALCGDIPFKHRIHQMKIAKSPAQIEHIQTLKKQKTND